MTDTAARYVQVAVPVPLPGLFTYRVPDDAVVGPGVRVKVQFGRRSLVGLVVTDPQTNKPAAAEGIKVRALSEVLDAAPIVDAPALRLAAWLADYYCAPPGECHALLLPPRLSARNSKGSRAHAFKTEDFVTRVEADQATSTAPLGARMKAVLTHLDTHGQTTMSDLRRAVEATRDVVRRLEGRGLVTVESRRVNRDPFAGVVVERDSAPELTAEQIAAVFRMGAALGGYQGFLLHGVTGSGKTEVYLALIEKALQRNRGALVLVPEIALTPQLVDRFRARLGDKIAVQHSGLDPDARHEQWLRIKAGELPVVIGARSALFAPLPNLGIIIVDEEHEPSYKQESSPRYQARDLALVRGHLQQVPVVLGSATPSLESWANVGRGKLTRVSLTKRVHDRGMPVVERIDMRVEPLADPDGLFSKQLLDAVEATVEQGDQVILFLNRRGFASFVLCRSCGSRLECDACSVTYTWHQRRGRLVCHLCDQTRRLPAQCPFCDQDTLAEMGFGTEQVEARLKTLLPDARVARMDRDTTRGRALQRLLDDFRAGKIDVLVGTQMVAKGHDFPNVTLVGVLLAESGLSFPDFRAAERTFHLLTQIAGRAGRASKSGRVLVQTYKPEHYVLERAVTHDVTGFLADELALREIRRFPPESHLAMFRLAGRDGARVAAAARRLEADLVRAAPTVPNASFVRVYPAQPAPIERINHRVRFQLLVAAQHRANLRHMLAAAKPWLTDGHAGPGVHVIVDVDPLSFL
ncbi:MAG: primosomal protein N' (replication factor Y) [Myxococcota bacterium]